MKRQERRHLKENELAHSIAAAREYLEPRSKQLRAAVIAVVALIAIALVVLLVRQRSTAKSEQLLADALVALNARVIPPTDAETADLPASAQLGATGTFPTEEAKLKAAMPKLREAADAYPDTRAGIIARYHLAGALAALGQSGEAAKEFGSVAARAGDDTLYGRMARLGEAESQTRAGQLDAAIASWKQLAAKKDEDLPADAILFGLARAYAAKGDTEDARKTFTELVDQHPQSPYLSEARSELEQLKG
ncbi:MAG TPA: tetratricopeptide repeat protein [Vicinamibacterales bacterium]|nr:tetratricopeptide repeat protein [Vicinamibacterales bacterium]